MPTSVEGRAYLDASALVKLVFEEAETLALRRALERTELRTSSSIARVEVLRAARSHDADSVSNARAVLEGVALIGLEESIMDVAADLEAPLRSLDAIHVATALTLGDDIDVLVTYDARMIRAAEAHGLTVVTPR